MNENAYIEEIERLKEQIIQNDKLASIGQLSAGIAHEINNPLGFIMSNFETLKKYNNKIKQLLSLYRECLNEDSEEYKEIKKLEKKYHIDYILEDLDELLNDSGEGLNRVEEIVKGLKRFSGAAPINDFGAYDLNQGIKDTLIIARNATKYHANVNIELEEIPYVSAIEGEINQVILNMIINAVHAIQYKKLDGLGDINIHTYSDDENVYLSIRDNGIGIKDEIKDKIYNPFYTTKSKDIGTGLGLSIASEIINKKHNGEIICESTYGIGTEFIIKLPIKKAE